MIKINQMEVKRCNDRGINVLRNREGPALSQTPGFFVISLVVISREA